MNNPLGVRGVEALGDVDGDGEKRFELHRAAGDGVLERLAVEKFHGDEGLAGFFADVVNRADVGMIQ
jgi:hypothetical protein